MLWKDEDVRRAVSRSKLYMIGQRREVFFDNPRSDPSAGTLVFDLVSGEERISDVILPLEQFPIKEGANLILEGSKKVFKFKESVIGESLQDAELIHWFTPARLFMYYARGEIIVQGLEGFRKFTEFDLYYVGISKSGDSFSRLFRTAHEKRSRILGNETQLTPAARLTDELMIFLFEVEDLQIISYDLSDFENDEFDVGNHKCIDPATLAADAEKAFISILKSKYNEVKYESYPKSIDGLWGAGFDRYAFVINEAISFKTDSATIHGHRKFGPIEGEGDMISIEGDKVTLFTYAQMKSIVEGWSKSESVPVDDN